MQIIKTKYGENEKTKCVGTKAYCSKENRYNNVLLKTSFIS